MTKIDENYMDIKPQTNMHISEGWRAYRHDRLFIEVYNTCWHKELLAIRRIFSLVGMITNINFSNCPNVF